MPFLIGFSLLFLILVSVVLIRAVGFRPKPQKVAPREDVTFDREAAVAALQQLVRCKTISCNDPALEDEAEFQKLIDLLPQLYPEVFRVCSLQKFPGRGLLFRWPGTTADAPTVLMAHYDVVSVSEENWEKPPFAGIIEDGRATCSLTKHSRNGNKLVE